MSRPRRAPRPHPRARWPRAAAILILGLALFLAPAAMAATLTATVDRTQVSLGETLTLILSLTGGDSTRPPDLSGLSADFDILDRRRGSRQATVDGKRVLVNDWVLTLAPRRSGPLTIPQLSVSGVTSQAIRIDAAAPEPAPKGEAKPLFVEVDVAPGAVYAQGEIPVHVRVYDSLGMRSGSISQIRADGASFREEGEQDSYLKTIGKTRYRVVQQNYVMTPQRSGSLTIEPVELKATVPVPVDGPLPSEMARLLGRANVPMPWLEGAMTRGQDVTLRSAPVKVEVLARPGDAQGWFLPARRVTLADHWSPELAKAKVGETLTRTLTLEAVGASPNQLPPLDTPEVDGVRQYQEDSRTDAAMIGGEPGATLIKTVSVVPTQAGAVTLPAVTVGWWNTVTKSQDYATLPPVTFTVAPAATPAAPPPAAATVSAPSAGEQTPQTPLKFPEEEPAGGKWGEMASEAAAWAIAQARRFLAAQDFTDAPWLAGAAGGMLVALLLAFGIRRRRPGAPGAWRSPRSQPPQARPAFGRLTPQSAEAAERDLKSACRAKDARAAHAAYLAWERAARPGAAGAHAAPAFTAALEELRAQLYGPPQGPWRADRFLSAWKAERKRASRAAKSPRGARLAPLYPEG